VRSLEPIDKIITAVCRAANVKMFFEVSFGWVECKKSHDGSKLAQVKDLDKLAFQPYWTTCCVGAMKSSAIILDAFVKNLVIYAQYLTYFGHMLINDSPKNRENATFAYRRTISEKRPSPMETY
jgi:hypothetical protein